MSPRKEGKDLLSPEPWFVDEFRRDQERKDLELEKLRAEIRERRAIEKILSIAIPVLIVLTLGIIVADGFNLWNMDIDTTTINILAGAVIPETLSLFAIALRGVWSKQTQKED